MGKIQVKDPDPAASPAENPLVRQHWSAWDGRAEEAAFSDERAESGFGRLRGAPAARRTARLSTTHAIDMQCSEPAHLWLRWNKSYPSPRLRLRWRGA